MEHRRPARPLSASCCWSSRRSTARSSRPTRPARSAIPDSATLEQRAAQKATAVARWPRTLVMPRRYRVAGPPASRCHRLRPCGHDRLTVTSCLAPSVLRSGWPVQHQVPPVAPSIQEPVEVPLGPLARSRARSRTTSDARASRPGAGTTVAPEPGVLDAERPLDVGGPVPPELLVEETRLGEHLATEGHQVALDRVARARAGRLLELPQVRGHDAERAADAELRIGERVLRGGRTRRRWLRPNRPSRARCGRANAGDRRSARTPTPSPAPDPAPRRRRPTGRRARPSRRRRRTGHRRPPACARNAAIARSTSSGQPSQTQWTLTSIVAGSSRTLVTSAGGERPLLLRRDGLQAERAVGLVHHRPAGRCDPVADRVGLPEVLRSARLRALLPQPHELLGHLRHRGVSR